MENASKALFIAAGVIIALMVISLGVYLFITFGQTAANTHEQVKEYQLNQFNSQYISYRGRTDLTIYDVITVANMATQNNINYELEETYRNDQGSYYIAVNNLELPIGSIYHGENKNIEKGFRSGATNVNAEDLARRHMEAMMNPNGRYKEYSLSTHEIHNCLPKIECKNVTISDKTR